MDTNSTRSTPYVGSSSLVHLRLCCELIAATLHSPHTSGLIVSRVKMSCRRFSSCAAVMLVSALVACLLPGTAAARHLFQAPSNATASNATTSNATASNGTANGNNITGYSGSLPGATAAASPLEETLDLASIPEACINGGTELQTYCSDSITAAQDHFNVQPDAGVNGNPPLNITDEQVQEYVRTAPPPSPLCCKAACDFNANYCNCNRGILTYAEQLTGNNANIYRSIAESFQSVCGYSLMYGPTCPPLAQRPILSKQVCKAAAPEPQVTPAGGPADHGTG